MDKHTPIAEGRPAPAASAAGGRIMLADDDEKYRRLLTDLLSADGYTVQAAADGLEALRLVSGFKPETILLDVMMPQLDGVETCRRLKADPATASIPILLVTALHERADRLKGIQAGADDFLTKPIDREELRLRIRNAVFAKRLYDKVQDDYLRLQELETLRDNLTKMITHDLRAPLALVSGYLEMLQISLAADPAAKETQYLASAMAGTHRLSDMITTLLDVTKLEAQAWRPVKSEVDLNELIPESIKYIDGLGGGTPIAFCPAPSAPLVFCDRQLIERVVINLLSNAVKYAGSRGKVGIALAEDERRVLVRVTDDGPGIPPEYHRKIFEKFGVAQLRKDSSLPSVGLGLAFCKLAVEAHGGEIGVASEPGRGSTFTFSIPKVEKPDAAGPDPAART